MGKGKSERQITVKFTLRAYEHTPMGQFIEFLQTHPSGADFLAEQSLKARLMPLSLNRDDERLERLGIQSIGELKGFMAAIASYCGLSASERSPREFTSSGVLEEERLEKSYGSDSEEARLVEKRKLHALDDADLDMF